MGVIAFHGVGQGEPVCGRFQVEVANTPEKEGRFWLMPAREGTHLHCQVTGSVNNSELYDKDEPEYEWSHISVWMGLTSGEVHRVVSGLYRV